MRLDFPKEARLRARRHFQRVARQPTKISGKCVILEYRPNGLLGTRVGITVSRHYGPAVTRNRFKRIVREAFRIIRGELTPGLDIIIKPRNGAYKAAPLDIISDLLALKKTT